MAISLKSRSEERLFYWLFSLPALILYVFVFAFPIILSAVISLSNYKGGQMFGGEAWSIVGFQQFGVLFSDPAFWQALKNNFYIVLISVFGQLPLGFLLAYLVFRKIVKFGDFWQGILYVPAIISVIVLGIMWKMIFSSDGLIADLINKLNLMSFQGSLRQLVSASGGFNVTDDFVQKILNLADPAAVSSLFTNPVAELKDYIVSSGFGPSNIDTFVGEMANLMAPKWHPDFLAKQDIAMIPILFVTLWCWTGMYLILFLANMQKIDTEIMEAAKIDGANEMQIARHIVYPALSGIIFNAAVLCIAGSLNQYALIYAMTGGGPMNVTEVLSIYMYRTATLGANYPLSNAIAMVIILISFLLIGITKAAEKRFGGKE